MTVVIGADSGRWIVLRETNELADKHKIGVKDLIDSVDTPKRQLLNIKVEKITNRLDWLIRIVKLGIGNKKISLLVLNLLQSRIIRQWWLRTTDFVEASDGVIIMTHKGKSTDYISVILSTTGISQITDWQCFSITGRETLIFYKHDFVSTNALVVFLNCLCPVFEWVIFSDRLQWFMFSH